MLQNQVPWWACGRAPRFVAQGDPSEGEELKDAAEPTAGIADFSHVLSSNYV